MNEDLNNDHNNPEVGTNDKTNDLANIVGIAPAQPIENEPVHSEQSQNNEQFHDNYVSDDELLKAFI